MCWLYTGFLFLLASLALILVMLRRHQCFWVWINGYVWCSGVVVVVSFLCYVVNPIRVLIMYILDCSSGSNSCPDDYFSPINMRTFSYVLLRYGYMIIYVEDYRLLCWVLTLLNVHRCYR